MCLSFRSLSSYLIGVIMNKIKKSKKIKLKSNNKILTSKKKPSKLLAHLREKNYKKFLKQQKRFEKLTNEQLISEYLHLSTVYEAQKLYFSVLVIGVFLSVVSGVWGAGYQLLLTLISENTSKNLEKANMNYLPLVVVLFLAFLAMSIIIIIMVGISNIKSRYYEVLVIKEIRKKRKI